MRYHILREFFLFARITRKKLFSCIVDVETGLWCVSPGLAKCERFEFRRITQKRAFKLFGCIIGVETGLPQTCHSGICKINFKFSFN